MPEKSPRRRLNLLYDEDTVFVDDIADNFRELDKYDTRIQKDNTYLELGADDRPWLAFKTTSGGANSAFVEAPADIEFGPDKENRLLTVTNYSSLGAVVGRLDENLVNYRYATGSVQMPGSGNLDTIRNLTITFPANYFSDEPLLFLQAFTSVPNAIRGPTWSGKTKTSATLYMARSNTTVTGVWWFAFEEI